MNTSPAVVQNERETQPVISRFSGRFTRRELLIRAWQSLWEAYLLASCAPAKPNTPATPIRLPTPTTAPTNAPIVEHNLQPTATPLPEQSPQVPSGVGFPDWHEVRNSPLDPDDDADTRDLYDTTGNPLPDFANGIAGLQAAIFKNKKQLLSILFNPKIVDSIEIKTSIHKTGDPNAFRWVIYAEPRTLQDGQLGILWLRNKKTGRYTDKPSAYPPDTASDDYEFALLTPLKPEHRLVITWHNGEWPVIRELDANGGFIRNFNQTAADWDPHHDPDTWNGSPDQDRQFIFDLWQLGLKTTAEIEKLGILEATAPFIKAFLWEKEYPEDELAKSLDEEIRRIITDRETRLVAAGYSPLDWARTFARLVPERGILTVRSIVHSPSLPAAGVAATGAIALTDSKGHFEALDYFNTHVPAAAKIFVETLEYGANLIKEGGFAALFYHVYKSMLMTDPYQVDDYFLATPGTMGIGEALTMALNISWWSWVKRNLTAIVPHDKELQNAVLGYAEAAIRNGYNHITTGNLDAINEGFPGIDDI